MKKTLLLKALLLHILFVIGTNAYGQTLGCFSNDCGAPTTSCEFVCNGSFECTNATVTDLGQIYKASNWVSMSLASPDLYIAGGVAGWYKAGCNAFGAAVPKTGSNYAGIVVGQSTTPYSEYLETELQNYMNAGKHYLISFWVARSSRSQIVVDNLGIWLTGSQIVDNTTLLYNALPPSAVTTNTSVLNNLVNWQQVKFCYTADGTERFLSIGRAAGMSNTALGPFTNVPVCNNTCPTAINFNIGYLYIDDVSVTELSIDAGPDVAACGQPSVQTNLQANVTCNSSLPWVYSWYPTTGLSSSTIANPVANVTNNTIYTVTGHVVDSENQYCSVSDNVSIVVGAPPALNISTDHPTVCTNINQSAVLSAGAYPPDFYTYTWQPGNMTGSSVTVTPLVPTVYTVTALYGNCTTTAAIEINTNNSCCSNTVNVITSSFLNSGTYTDIVLNNDVSIYGTVVFTGNVTIAPNVSIIANGATSGEVVYLNGAHLYGCADMWNGIVLNGDAVLKSAKGTLIEDAFTAISAVNTWGIYNAPSTPIIDVTETTFNRNQIGISISGYQLFGVGTTYPFVINNNVFTCRDLPFTATSWPTAAITSLKATCTSTAQYAPPFLNAGCSANYPQVNLKSPLNTRPSQIAIQLTNVGSTYNSGVNTGFNGIMIGDYSDATRFNLFDSHGVFIYATNSNVYSYNNVFQNTLRYKTGKFPRTTYFGGDAIYTEVIGGSNLNPLFNSLLDLNPNANSQQSLGNRFYDCIQAVNSINTFSMNVLQATIRSTHTTSAYSVFTAGYSGILANTNRFGGYTISSNYMNNIKNAINLTAPSGSYDVGVGTQTGIYMGNLAMQFNYIGATLNNTDPLNTNYLDHAISLSAPTSVPWQSAGNTGIYINSNTVDRAFNGISLNGINVVNNSVVNNKVVLTDENIVNLSQHGIEVLNSSNSAVQTNTLSAQNTTNTRVTLVYSSINTSPKVFCNTTNNSYKGFEFNSAHTGASIWKGNIMQTQAIGMSLTGGAILGAQGSSGSPSDNKWNGSWTSSNGTYVDGSSDAQYSKLWVKNSGVFIPPTPAYVTLSLSYAVATNTPNTSGTYVCGGGSGPPPGIVLQSGGDQSNPELKNISDYNLYKYLNTNPEVKNNDAGYTSFYNAKANTNIDRLMKTEVGFYTGRTLQALANSNSVNATNLQETNYKSFYSLYAKSKQNSFTDADSVDLFNLASLCATTNGAAVFQAIALYNNIYKTVLQGNNCSASEIITGLNNEGSITKDWNITVYPNPASDKIYIKYDTDKFKNPVLTVYDLTGRLILKQTNAVELNTANIENGTYLVTFTNDDYVKTFKINVLH